MSKLCLLKDLRCGKCGRSTDAGHPAGLCSCGRPLLARYDLARIDSRGWLQEIQSRPENMWRYREVLPSDRTPITLGEGFTPLLKASDSLVRRDGLPNTWFKWEGANPTGSFKARGMAAAITRATELGLRRFVVPTAGNAGVAAAAYVEAAGGEIDVFMPGDTDELFFAAAESYGARLHKVAGLISDCGREAQKVAADGAFDLSTLKEPFRLEGKKTMGYELWEQCDGHLPDVIVYPTGGGTGLIGLWKAFAELEEMGLLRGPKPRLVSVQMAGCAPMVRAHHEATEHAEPWIRAETDVLGLRVPGAVGDFLILRAIRESGGTAVSVEEEAAFEAVSDLHQETGLAVAPEGGAVFAALGKLIAAGTVKPDEHIVVLITGSADLYDGILRRHGVHVTGGRPNE